MFYPMLRYTLGTALHAVYRPWVEGVEHIPGRGPAIIACNHLAFCDSLFLPLMSPRKITFIAKIEYFRINGVRGRALAAFLGAVGTIPVDRAGGRGAVASLHLGLDVLRRGEIFGIYPEGTRSPDGRLYRGRTGVARLALEARVPVIPACVVDTDKAQPEGRLVPKPVRVGVRFGRPLYFGRYAGLADNRYIVRAVTDEVIDAIAVLSGQEYVDRYAQRKKR